MIILVIHMNGKNLCLCSLTIKILKLMNTLLLNATS
ncbi:hypothetical protein M125_5384, partial [Bacteroides fragilis str. 3998T(B)3]